MDERKGLHVVGNLIITRQSVVLAIILLALVIFPRVSIFARPFPQHLMIMVLLYAMLGSAWNILGGYAGQFAFGHGLYFGLGAYTSTMLLLKLGVTPWLGMLAGGVLAVLVSIIVGYPTFRLEGRHFAIATMSLAEITAVVFKNWPWVGEAIGLFLPLMPESFANFQFHSSKLPYYYIVLGLLVITLITVYVIERSRPGYYFKAIRENPVACRSLGISVAKYKQIAGAVSAFFTALAGTFYAQYVLYIDPVSVMQSFVSLLAILVAGMGGMGTLWGPTIGAVVLIPISELTRVHWGGGGRAVHLVYYGLLIMLIAAFQPQGLIGLLSRPKMKTEGRLRSGTARGD